jgi:hypothetical protein
MHLLSINTHSQGRGDSQANAIAVNSGHDDPDLLANHDFFADTPSKHQHGFPS